MFVVVAYDIANDKRRDRIAKILSDYGERVNFSVFECDFKNTAEFRKLRKKIKETIKSSEDHVRYYRVCKKCRNKMIVQGYGKIREETAVFFA